MGHLIAPSMLASDFGNLKSEVNMVNESQADWFHLDIMDGRFVPNISFGIPVVQAIKKYTKKPLDVHLMIKKPDNYINQFQEAGANILTVHYEACYHLHRTIQAIKNKNMKAGVAINPHTSVDVLHDILCEVDLVCIMSVNPGFGGQKFIKGTYDKVKRLRELKVKQKKDFLIEIDGGVSLENSQKLIQSGANVLVAGSSVFKAKNPSQMISNLKFMN